MIKDLIEKYHEQILIICENRGELEPLFVHVCANHLAHNKEISDNTILIEYFSLVVDRRKEEIKARAKILHRPLLVKEAQEYFTEVDEATLLDLPGEALGIIYLKAAVMQGERPQNYHIEAFSIAANQIEQLKDRYAADTIREVIDLYLYDDLKPIVNTYKLCLKTTNN